LASPLTKGLFSSALMESGECTARTRNEAEVRGTAIAASAGCTSGEVAGCLRGKSPSDLFSIATPPPNAMLGWDLAYAANVDGHVLERAPLDALRSGAFGQVPFVIGTNAYEMELFLGKNDVVTCADYQRYVEKTVPASIVADVEARYPCSAYAFPRWAA